MPMPCGKVSDPSPPSPSPRPRDEIREGAADDELHPESLGALSGFQQAGMTHEEAEVEALSSSIVVESVLAGFQNTGMTHAAEASSELE